MRKYLEGVRVIQNPSELITSLANNSLFKDWKKQHPQSFLSHFFCQLDSQFKVKSSWEIGYFNSETEKITIFTELEKNNFAIKPEDEVFKKKTAKVEKLDLEKVKISFQKAEEICKENLPKLFPPEKAGDGFVVLQTLEQKALWNFTFISKTLKFLNIKINAENGQVASHQKVEVVSKG